MARRRPVLTRQPALPDVRPAATMTDDKLGKKIHPHARRRTLRIEIAPKSFAIAVLVGGATWMLINLLPALLVLLMALMLVGTLNPAVQWLQ
jgi:hypothetical protein